VCTPPQESGLRGCEPSVRETKNVDALVYHEPEDVDKLVLLKSFILEAAGQARGIQGGYP
jgi:hypothetical protein